MTKTTPKDDRLQRKVAMVNELHAYANMMQHRITEALKPMIGKKVLLKDKSLCKAAWKLVTETEGYDTLRITHDYSAYFLRFHVLGIAQLSRYQSWHLEVSIYVGTLDNGVLHKMGAVQQLRTNYTVDAIKQAQADYQLARSQMDDAAERMRPFGDGD